MKKEINYYTMYVDADDGKTHYAINRYNRISGWVTNVRDHIKQQYKNK